jgi:hypothetical protein
LNDDHLRGNSSNIVINRHDILHDGTECYIQNGGEVKIIFIIQKYKMADLFHCLLFDTLIEYLFFGMMFYQNFGDDFTSIHQLFHHKLSPKKK